jgi:hypothetical protein
VRWRLILTQEGDEMGRERRGRGGGDARFNGDPILTGIDGVEQRRGGGPVRGGTTW